MSVTGYIVGWRIRGSVFETLGGYGLMIASAFAMICIGVLLGSLVATPEGVTGIAFATLFPITFVASTFVPLTSMPEPLRTFAAWNPTATLSGALRQLFQNPNARVPPGGPWSLAHPLPTRGSGSLPSSQSAPRWRSRPTNGPSRANAGRAPRSASLRTRHDPPPRTIQLLTRDAAGLTHPVQTKGGQIRWITIRGPGHPPMQPTRRTGKVSTDARHRCPGDHRVRSPHRHHPRGARGHRNSQDQGVSLGRLAAYVSRGLTIRPQQCRLEMRAGGSRTTVPKRPPPPGTWAGRILREVLRAPPAHARLPSTVSGRASAGRLEY